MALYKSLEPGAAFHGKRLIDDLKSKTLEVQKLMQQLPVAVTGAWQEDLSVALKAIVQQPSPPKKKPKPELQTEDDYDQYIDLYEDAAEKYYFDEHWP